ncbi:MAG: FecR domain-containing protein [Gallionella sp.]
MKITRFFLRRAFAAALACVCLFSIQAWALDGYVIDIVGNVSVANGKDAAHPAVKNEVISSDTEVKTGDKSYAVLKFEDGQVATMQANTAFHVVEYHYDPKLLDNGKAIFSSTKGGMRFITGLIGQHNHNAFRLSTPNATIDIRGTEFMVAMVDGTLYSQVKSGSIGMTNAAGSAIFKAGQAIQVKSVRTLPTAIPATELPPGIFGQLDAISITPVTPALVPEAGAAAMDIPAPEPSARTISITGSGATYTGADLACDFCTGRTKTVATHVDTNTADGGPVTGDATLFGKHNLTPTGANTGEICAFCHTPQGAEDTVSAPRWNRTLTTLSSYRTYSSLGSAVPEAAGSISMACLACHDGTQAPNIVMNTPNLRLNIGDVRIDIGNDLGRHHPVGIQYGGGGENQYAPDIPSNPVAAYDRLVDMNKFATNSRFGSIYLNFGPTAISPNQVYRDTFGDVLTFSNEGSFDSTKGGFNKSTYSGTGSGTVWWIKTPGSKKGRQKTDLYLFTRTDTIEDAMPDESVLNRPYVECATCHDPHSVNPTFLRMPGGNARSQICLACHNK